MTTSGRVGWLRRWGVAASRLRGQTFGLWGLVVLSASLAARGDDPVLRERARAALRKAVEFYRTRVSTQGGYHFQYTEDLSYGRSEMSEGPTRVEVERDGTPIVGMAYLDAYEATRDTYYLEGARDVARALVRGQLCSGGWDYSIEFDTQKRSQFPYRADGKCGESAPSRAIRPTTLDDNVTQAAVRLLMRVDRDLDFKDAPIHEAALFALDSLIKAQYPNGAWPQRYSRVPDPSAFPVKPASYPDSWPRTWPGSDYQGHYTFNDDSIIDMIDAMLEAAQIYKEPRYLASAEQGGEFILLAQMPEPQPGWAQQYDREMHPAWARAFEPPSVGSNDPHRPYEPGSGAKSGMKTESVKVPAFLPDTPEVRSDLLDYYFEVQRFDRDLGRIVSTLERLGELEHTIIIVTGDNGMPFPRAKANVYDAGVWVPLAIRWPGTTRPTSVIDRFVSLTDLAPTILEAAGVQVPVAMTGRSVLPLLRSESQAGRDRVFLERERHAHVRQGNLSLSLANT